MKNKRWIAIIGVALAVVLAVGLTVTWAIPAQWAAPTIGQGYRSLTVGHMAYAATGELDYVCDGTDDNVQFQAALDALPSGGGELIALAGDYSFSATVTRAIGNVTIEGVGRSTSFAYDASSPIFTAGGNNWVFRDFITDAGGINTGATTGWVKENIAEGTGYIALQVSGNITPSANNTYSLGTDVLRWMDVYVAGGTIYLGSVNLTDLAGCLTTNEIHLHGNEPTGIAGYLKMRFGTTPTHNETDHIILWSGGNATFQTLYLQTQTGSDLEVVKLDSSGRLGIGTNSPESKLHLADVVSLQLILNADTDDSGESDVPSILFRRDGITDSFIVGVEGVADTAFTGSLDNTPYLKAVGTKSIQFATNGILSMEITSGRDIIIKDVLEVENEIRLNTDGHAGDPGYTWESDADTGLFRGGTNILAFTTGGSEAMRIDANRNVGIAATTPGGDGFPNDFTAGGTLLEIGDGTKDSGITFRSRSSGGNAFDIWQDWGGINLYIDSRRNDDISGIYFRTKTNGTPVNALTILSNGYIDMPGVYAETTASAANVFVASDGSLRRSTSSRELKENIDYEGINPYLVLQFKPVSFDTKADGSHHLGFVAEDMRDIDPRLATGDDLPGLDTHAILAVLTAYVQELENRVTVLETR